MGAEGQVAGRLRGASWLPAPSYTASSRLLPDPSQGTLGTDPDPGAGDRAGGGVIRLRGYG